MLFHGGEPEGTQLDYKLALEDGKPKSWLKSVSAFANSHGGDILFGVTNDTHTAVGVGNAQHEKIFRCQLYTSECNLQEGNG